MSSVLYTYKVSFVQYQIHGLVGSCYPLSLLVALFHLFALGLAFFAVYVNTPRAFALVRYPPVHGFLIKILLALTSLIGVGLSQHNFQ